MNTFYKKTFLALFFFTTPLSTGIKKEHKRPAKQKIECLKIQNGYTPQRSYKANYNPIRSAVKNWFIDRCENEDTAAIIAILHSQCAPSRAFIKKIRYYRKHQTGKFTDIDRTLRSYLRAPKESSDVKNGYDSGNSGTYAPAENYHIVYDNYQVIYPKKKQLKK